MGILKKEKKEEYEEHNGIFGNAVDYAVYHMTFQDTLIGMAAGFVIGFVAFQVFFQIWILSLIGAAAMMFVGRKVYKSIRKNKRDSILTMQFKDMLEALATSYDSGKNTPDAFVDAYKDMREQYGESSYIVRELAIIAIGMRNNVNIEDLLSDFALRSGNEDIRSFADVFEAANRTGGNIRSIVTNTKNVISEKINIEMEIATLVSGKKNELNIMIVLPFIIVTQIQGFQGEMDSSGMLISFISRVVALAIFGIAYAIGQKMVDIKV